jgi:ribosomal protein L11 methyltransferase
LIRLAVRVNREYSEVVLAELLELSPSGVEEVELPGEEVEYALYGAPGELPALPDLQAAAGSALVEVSTSEVADDWSERWRQFHRPLVLGDELTVRPPWAPAGVSKLDLVIEPGRAFGTGSHATTRLCLELMLTLDPAGGFLDVGCGSGVLAIVAAALGWERVLAVDNDRVCLETTQSNALANEVTLETGRLDVRSDALPAGYDVLAANLSSQLLIKLVERIPDPSPRVIASGLLVEELDSVRAAFAGRGMSERACRTLSGWAALLFADG